MDSFTIFSGVKSVSLYKEKNNNIVLGVSYEDGNNIEYVISEWKDNCYQNIYTAFLMNNKGETIEKIR